MSKISFIRYVPLLLLLLLPVKCIAQLSARRHVVVILADALRFEDIENPECAALKQMALNGALGVMNCAVAGARNGATANLTLAAGRQIAADATDVLAFNDWEAVPGENGEARMAYMRRVGPLNPAASRIVPDAGHAVKHLGIASLARRDLGAKRLGAVLANQKPPITTWVGGNVDTYSPDRSASLLTVDEMGVGAGLVSLLRFDNSDSFGLVDDPLAMIQTTSEAAATFDFVVIQTGDLGRLEAARPYLTDQQFHARRDAALRRLNILVNGLNESESAAGADLMLVSPRPVANPARHGAWDRLTPIIAVGPDFTPGLLTSATTRRQGLVANIDFAPTILSLFHILPPVVMTGHTMSIVGNGSADAGERIAAAARIDFVAGLNETAKKNILLPLGVVCFLIVATSLLSTRYSAHRSHWFATGFVFILNLPAAMLLAPILVPPTLLEYGLRIVAWSAALTVFCYLPAYLWRISPIVTAMAATVALITADIVTGQLLQKDSLFCVYAVAGIRFYGIGNEYLGVLIAFSIMAVFCLLDAKAAAESRLIVTKSAVLCATITWIAIAFICGWPGLGSNAGSLAVTAAAFGIGLQTICGRKPSWRSAALFTAIGLAVAFLFGSLDTALNGPSSSHLGAAMHSAYNGRGIGYLAEIAARKLMLNLHFLTAPGFLAGLAAIILCVGIATALTGKALEQLLRKRDWLARSLYPMGAAAAAALLFKDSGVVTMDFMAGSVVVVLLYYVIAEGRFPASVE
jgi:hypothetical protein